MQTFLPYADFEKSAQCLDYRRLGKQRVEARQILNTLLHGGSWQKHPAVLMWKDYKDALAVYSNVMICEWIRRGYVNNMKIISIENLCSYPLWFGDERLHASHRSNLLRKYPEYYSQYNWPESNDLPYFWPTKQ